MSKKIILIIGLLLVISLINFSSATISSSWGYKANITLNRTMINGTHTNFPILLTEDNMPTGIWALANINGSDIRFSNDSAGSEELAREIVSWNNVTNKTEIWVKVNLTENTDKTIWIWYDYDDAEDYAPSDTYGAENVWDNGYVFVSHNGGLNDSTLNDNDAISQNGGISGGGITGKIGSATYFDGTDDYFLIGKNNLEFGTSTNFTISAWIKQLKTPGAIYGYGDRSDSSGLTLYGVSTTNSTNLLIDDSVAQNFVVGTENTMIPNQWTHLFVGANRTQNIYGFVNGYFDKSNSSASTTGSLNTDDHDNPAIGCHWYTTYTNHFKGYIDEIRVTNTTKDSYWINTEYKMMNNPALFAIEGEPYSLRDIVAPNIAINAPVNNSNSSSQTINFNFTATDETISTLICSIYLDGVSNSTNSSVLNDTLTNFEISNIAGANHTWYITCFDGTNTNTSETRNFYTDIYAPSSTSILYSPNSTGDLDPEQNITFNATITDDITEVDSAILQYYNGTDWTNSSMTSENGLYYNTTITLESSPTNYTFNIWANDSYGNSNFSTNQTFTSDWDCEWQITTTGTGYDLGSTGGYGSFTSLGNVTINNTGDWQYSNNNCSITFARTASGSAWLTGQTYSNNAQILNFTASPYFISEGFPGDNIGLRYYNDRTEVTSIIVNASENKTIEVKGYFPTTATTFTEYPYFPIWASINDSVDSDSSATISMTMVVTPGAYLSTAISTPSTTSQNVYLTAGNTSLQAYIKDVVSGESNANNTAYNVSFNWTIPSTISSLFSGNVTSEYENINDTTEQYLNLTLELTASNIVSLTQETYELKIYGYGYENSTGSLTLINHTEGSVISDAVNISFLCYFTSDGVCVTACGYLLDDDCTQTTTTTTTTTTSSGGGGGGVVKTEAVKSSDELQLIRGDQNEVRITFENKDTNQSIKNAVFSVSGKIAKYIDILPKEISIIEPGQEVDITLIVLSPTYIDLGEQIIKITLTGMKGSKKYTDTKEVTLEIHEISLDKAKNLMEKSKELLIQFNESNLSSDSLNKLLDESQNALDNFDLEKVRDNYEEINKQVQFALDSQKMIEELSALIEIAQKKGISVSESSKLLKLAKVSMERDEFEQAYTRIKEAQLVHALEIKGEMANLGYYAKEYPVEISFGTFFFLIFSFGAYNLNKLRRIKKRLKSLKKEENILNDLIKIVQKECFKDKKMSMDEYETAIKEYNKRLSKIIEEIIELETERVHMLKFSSKTKKLENEKDKIISLMKGLQKEYLKDKKVETRIYELKIESFNRRLSEIEEHLATLEAEKAIKHARKQK